MFNCRQQSAKELPSRQDVSPCQQIEQPKTKKKKNVQKKNFEKDSDRYFICNRSKRNVNEGHHEHVTAQRQAQCEQARITRSSLRILFGRVLENEKKERKNPIYSS
jgi:hypothetical protein